MKRSSSDMAVGLFLLVGLASVGYLVVAMGQIANAGYGGYEVAARFSSSSGLREGAFVEMAGVRVGQVVNIDFDEENYISLVTLRLSPKVRLQEDAIASIRTSGIIGDKFVKLSPGGSDRYIAAGEIIRQTEPSINLEELISKYIFESGA